MKKKGLTTNGFVFKTKLLGGILLSAYKRRLPDTNFSYTSKTWLAVSLLDDYKRGTGKKIET